MFQIVFCEKKARSNLPRIFKRKGDREFVFFGLESESRAKVQLDTYPYIVKSVEELTKTSDETYPLFPSDDEIQMPVFEGIKTRHKS